MTSEQPEVASTETAEGTGDVTDALTIEEREITDLRPHPRNYRRHPGHQLAILRESLRVHGQQKPVVITPDGTILAGHGLVEAAKLEGWAEIACHVYDGPYPEAFLAIDNRSGDLAEDDEAALAQLLRDLDSQDQLSAAGWESDDLGELLLRLDAQGKRGREESFDAEMAMAEAEQQEAPTRVQPGELWQLGRHRLLCGDCTLPQNWQQLMGEELAHAIITDPPYAVGYTENRGDSDWDSLTTDEYQKLLVTSLQHAHAHSDGPAPLYLWFASSRIRTVLASLAEAGWKERSLLIWVKNHFTGNLFSQYKFRMEPLYYCHKQGQAPRWHGPTNETNVWEHDKPSSNELHPTMKPLPLIERSIENATETGQLVVDPFLGSGTAIMAAERTGRVCHGLELDARYCDVILTRWESFTEEKGVRIDV